MTVCSLFLFFFGKFDLLDRVGLGLVKFSLILLIMILWHYATMFCWDRPNPCLSEMTMSSYGVLVSLARSLGTNLSLWTVTTATPRIAITIRMEITPAATAPLPDCVSATWGWGEGLSFGWGGIIVSPFSIHVRSDFLIKLERHSQRPIPLPALSWRHV